MPTVRSDNKGVTVTINLWSLEKYIDDVDAGWARLHVKGEVRNAETNERMKFNDPGQLITILGKWNVAKYKQLKAAAKKKPTTP